MSRCDLLKRTGWVAGFGFCAAASHANSFEFFAFDAEVNPGETVWVDLYLDEIFGLGGSSIIDAEGGLFSAEFVVEKLYEIDSPSESFISDVFINNDFGESDFSIDEFGESADAYLAVAFDAPGVVSLGEIRSNGEPIGVTYYLGDVQITGGDTIGDVTEFSLFDGPDVNFVTDFGTTLDDVDDDPISDITFTVTVVPEPASVTLVLGGAALMFSRRRK